MIVEASFVRSAASAADLPKGDLAEIALVGRSNVGKSSLINALVRRTIARTSAAPGKTRLANIYRVTRARSRACYLVDLPGYGYARGDRAEIDAIAREYFGRADRRSLGGGGQPDREPDREPNREIVALLVVDARHPGLASDVEAWRWLQSAADRAAIAASAIVASKIDKLSRAERLRAMKTNEAVFEHPVLPVSADTGEGLDELWKLIDRLLNTNSRIP